jgi:hypothetical protein
MLYWELLGVALLLNIGSLIITGEPFQITVSGGGE